MRSCRVSDGDLFEFIDGVELPFDPDMGLDAHVETCDECQAFLAETWAGELEHDLTEPVIRQLQLEKFMADIARLMLGVTGRYANAAKRYLFDSDD